MSDRTSKAIRIIERLRDRQDQTHAALVAQARVIAELSCASSDLFDLTERPLNFLRALLAQVRDTFGPDTEILIGEKQGQMRMALIVNGRSRVFGIDPADYGRSLEQVLADMKTTMENP